MKIYHQFLFFLAIISCCISECTKKPKATTYSKGGYLSHSPYYTPGYLGARRTSKRNARLKYGPSPYSHETTLSGTRHTSLPNEAWRKKIV